MLASQQGEAAMAHGWLAGAEYVDRAEPKATARPGVQYWIQLLRAEPYSDCGNFHASAALASHPC
jgi:hypothetical protein